MLLIGLLKLFTSFNFSLIFLVYHGQRPLMEQREITLVYNKLAQGKAFTHMIEIDHFW